MLIFFHSFLGFLGHILDVAILAPVYLPGSLTAEGSLELILENASRLKAYHTSTGAASCTAYSLSGVIQFSGSVEERNGSEVISVACISWADCCSFTSFID